MPNLIRFSPRPAEFRYSLRICHTSNLAGVHRRFHFPRFAAYCEDSASRPNIVLVLADDMGYGDLGCYGCGHPHATYRLAGKARAAADELLRQRSECTPTRTALMTGRYQQRVGGTRYAMAWSRPLRRRHSAGHETPAGPARQTKTLVQGLIASGYATAICANGILATSRNSCP